MEGIPFTVDESPYAFWDWDLTERNLAFLRGIDATYFEYVVESNIEHLSGDNKQHAALSIRLAYSQAIETLFALLGALVQAPHCPLGWLLSYRQELPEVVRKISKHEPIKGRLSGCDMTWHGLSSCVHSHLAYEAEKKTAIHSRFADCWTRFAQDFLNPVFTDEYNSIKHGLRASLGGFSLAVGTEVIPGVPAPAEAMQLVGESTFGTSFFVRERIGTTGVNYRPRRYNRNWNPENILNAVVITAMSINNTISCLRIVNGDPPEQCEFKAPTTLDFFDAPWSKHVSVTQMNMDTVVTESDIAPQSKAEIVASYTNS